MKLAWISPSLWFVLAWAAQGQGSFIYDQQGQGTLWFDQQSSTNEKG